MTETDTLITNMMAHNRRDTTYPRPFVGTLFQDLMERSGTELGTRGMHRFTDAHMLYVLCLCGSGRISRQELAERTGVGEGAVRNMLSCLRRMGLIETTRRGNVLTAEGIKLRDMTGIVLPGCEVSGIVEGECNYALLARGKGRLLDSSIAYRDAAIRVGAKSCILIRMDGGKVFSPYCESVQLGYPDLSDLAAEIGMRDGDVVVVCGADTLQIASSAAFGAMTKLLSKTVDSERYQVTVPMNGNARVITGTSVFKSLRIRIRPYTECRFAACPIRIANMAGNRVNHYQHITRLALL